MQGYIVCFEFLLFIGMVLLRVAMLRKNGVKAFVFGVTDKSDFILIPFALFVIYAALANAFAWPLPLGSALNRHFYRVDFPRWEGVAFCTAALAGIAASLVSFGDSFRVGIDEKQSGKLVTTGIFAISRNPVYVSFFMFFLGLFLAFPTILFLVVVLLFAAALHRQVLREEKFLRVHYGAEYEAYCRRVRRYI